MPLDVDAAARYAARFRHAFICRYAEERVTPAARCRLTPHA